MEVPGSARENEWEWGSEDERTACWPEHIMTKLNSKWTFKRIELTCRAAAKAKQGEATAENENEPRVEETVSGSGWGSGVAFPWDPTTSTNGLPGQPEQRQQQSQMKAKKKGKNHLMPKSGPRAVRTCTPKVFRVPIPHPTACLAYYANSENKKINKSQRLLIR